MSWDMGSRKSEKLQARRAWEREHCEVRACEMRVNFYLERMNKMR
jgi:hypothetical protein